MIEMSFQKGLACPRIRCDACGEWINDHSLGLVGFERKGEPYQPGLVKFYHKGSCDPGYSVFRAWTNLDVFIYRLAHNLKIDMEAARKSALVERG